MISPLIIERIIPGIIGKLGANRWRAKKVARSPVLQPIRQVKVFREACLQAKRSFQNIIPIEATLLTFFPSTDKGKIF